MFILRRITQDGIQMNDLVGESYTVIHREFNPQRFTEHYEKFFKTKQVDDLDSAADTFSKDCYAFVVNCSPHKEVYYDQPLFKKQQNYMMTSTGQTFENLSFK